MQKLRDDDPKRSANLSVLQEKSFRSDNTACLGGPYNICYTYAYYIPNREKGG